MRRERTKHVFRENGCCCSDGWISTFASARSSIEIDQLALGRSVIRADRHASAHPLFWHKLNFWLLWCCSSCFRSHLRNSRYIVIEYIEECAYVRLLYNTVMIAVWNWDWFCVKFNLSISQLCCVVNWYMFILYSFAVSSSFLAFLIRHCALIKKPYY